MLKRCFMLLIMIALMATPLTCSAENYQITGVFADMTSGDFISGGYTEKGVYYEVYGESVTTYSAGYITVTRTVIYDGVVRPSSTLAWEELIDGAMYSGTLSLVSFSIKDGKTEAVYTGKLYKE